MLFRSVKLLGRLGFGGVIDQAPWICFAVFIIAVTAACFFLRNTQEKVQDMRYTAWRMAAVIGLLMWSILSLSDVSEFLYFNF